MFHGVGKGNLRQVNKEGIMRNSTDNFLLVYPTGLGSVSANKGEFISSNPRPEDIPELEGRKAFVMGIPYGWKLAS